MIVRGSWPHGGDGDDSRPDPRQFFTSVALAVGIAWGTATLVGLVVWQSDFSSARCRAQASHGSSAPPAQRRRPCRRLARGVAAAEAPVVAGSQEDLRLVLQAVPPARPPQARSDPLGAGIGAERAAVDPDL